MLSKNQCWRCDVVTSQGKKCGKCHVAYYCSDQCSNTDEFTHRPDCHDVAVRYVCRGCGKKANEKMMMCSNCMKAWFCGQECLKKSWGDHKTECKQVSTLIRKLATEIKANHDFKQNVLGHGTAQLYYFGNSPSLDLLNLSMNEGFEYCGDLSLLLCGVGDPRNVCLTISKLQTTNHGKVNFVLNDICACVLARTVLLLYLLCKVGEDAAEAVTQIWYSLHLSQKHHELLVSCLEDLVRISNLEVITRGIMKIDDDEQFNRLQVVWKTWLCLSREETNLLRERRKMFDDDPKAREGIKFLLEEIPDQHKRSMNEWFKHGVLLSQKKRKEANKDNFTLMGSAFYPSENTGPFVYNIGSDCMPFLGWDYKDASAAYPEITDVNEMYNRYITDVLQQCAARLQSDRIQMSFIVCPCQDLIPYIPDGMTFDRITTSNLWDYIRLQRLFSLLKLLLNPANRSAAILTESQNWHQLFPLLEMQKVCTIKYFPNIKEKVFQDTGNMSIARSWGFVGFRDYVSVTEEFTCFVRASLQRDDSNPKSSSLLPSLDQVSAKFGLKPRDFSCHGNRISPFRWKLNCRRITMILGIEGSVEWTLL